MNSNNIISKERIHKKGKTIKQRNKIQRERLHEVLKKHNYDTPTRLTRVNTSRPIKWSRSKNKKYDIL